MEYQKYLKYKNKYIELKKKSLQLRGGSMYIHNRHNEGNTENTPLKLTPDDSENELKDSNGTTIELYKEEIINITHQIKEPKINRWWGAVKKYGLDGWVNMKYMRRTSEEAKKLQELDRQEQERQERQWQETQRRWQEQRKQEQQRQELQQQELQRQELQQQEQQQRRQMFYKGSRFKDLRNGKEGTVQSLRDGELEQHYRRSDPTHYHYVVNYDDGSFESYLGQHNMILLSR